MGLIPVDLTGVLHKALRASVRPSDGLLHASSDLVGSLRHSMLHAAGAPRIESELISDVVLQTGTFWHRFFGEALVKEGIPFMQEVNVTPWLPEGWAGTADWIFWHPKHEAFALGDLKTTKGESFRFLRDEGAKLEHMWQLSAYWYALEKMGLPLIKGVAVYYLPKNNTSDKAERVEPILHEFEPLPFQEVLDVMESRWAATKEYLESLDYLDDPRWENPEMYITKTVQESPIFYVTEQLAEPQDRVQKLWWDGKAGVWNVKLVPHWSAAYCPYASDLCDCSEQGTEKIGHYSPDINATNWVEYTPRKGYEDIKPELVPDGKEVNKRVNELAKKEAK